MRHAVVGVMVATLGLGVVVDARAQRRGGGTAAFAVSVSSRDGAPLGGVKVTLDGPASREARTEAGRIAFENLPVGAYLFRFEREGYLTLEREVTARAGKPIEVKVALSPAPEPREAPAPQPPPPPRESPPQPMNVAPVTADIVALLDKEHVGRAPGRVSSLGCAEGGAATLIQIREPLDQHAHADADEFIYVIAGQGTASLQGRSERLQAGVFLLVPRGIPHTLAASGRTPLTVLSTRAGESCSR